MKKIMLIALSLTVISACTKKSPLQPTTSEAPVSVPAEMPVEPMPAPAPTPEDPNPTPSPTPNSTGTSETSEGSQGTESAPNL